MSERPYMPLPLRYRPRTLADVVGQKHVVAVLQSSLEKGRIFSSYIFAGVAGSGKTSTARIFAMALNCGEPAVELRPCLECPSCLAALKLKNPDILEIDGPSHGSVVQVRELREKAQFSPHFNRRIFVIDEVHALSADAFNALLKILEEPPPHVVFILCTTHPERIPATIHSRSIALSFRRHTERDVVSRLDYVARSESIDLPEDAAVLIARYADGHLRDALTVLDQLTSTHPGHQITSEIAADALGIVSGTELHTIMSSLYQRDAINLESAISTTLARTTEFGMIVREITEWYRDVLRVKAGASTVVRRAEFDLELITKFAEQLDFDKVEAALRLCWELSERVRFSSSNPKTFFLTGLYRLMLLREVGGEEVQIGPPELKGQVAFTQPTQPPSGFAPTSTEQLEQELADLAAERQ